MVKPGYKLTEVGEIPEDWEVRNWGEVASKFSSGATPYRGNPMNFQGNIKWVTSGELNFNTIYDTKEHISETAQRENNLTIHPKGTFLMAITGLEAQGTRGSCAFLGADATTNQSCMAIYGTDNIDLKFLYYYYIKNSDSLAFRYCQGTKQQSYTARIVKSLPIPLPPIREQKQIAEVLSDIDTLIAAQEKLLAKKKAIKQGAMEELLTGKTRLSGFVKDWNELPLCEMADIATATIPATQIKRCNYVGTENMLPDKGDVQPNNKEIPYKMIREYREGDILLSNIRPYLKKIWFAQRKGGCSNDVLVIRKKPEAKISSRYLFFLLSRDSFFGAVMGNAIGTKMPRGDKRYIESYLLRYPTDTVEQEAITSVFTDMDCEIAYCQSTLSKYNHLKSAAMQTLLTGKIRLIGGSYANDKPTKVEKSRVF